QGRSGPEVEGGAGEVQRAALEAAARPVYLSGERARPAGSEVLLLARPDRDAAVGQIIGFCDGSKRRKARCCAGPRRTGSKNRLHAIQLATALPYGRASLSGAHTGCWRYACARQRGATVRERGGERCSKPVSFVRFGGPEGGPSQ